MVPKAKIGNQMLTDFYVVRVFLDLKHYLVSKANGLSFALSHFSHERHLQIIPA